MNYNEIETNIHWVTWVSTINYLKENKISDEKEYLKSSIEIKQGSNGLFTFDNKRNITNASEYYNLSYEYINDCLRAGLVYRREF